MSLLLLVSVNPAIAHGANGSGGAQPASLSQNHRLPIATRVIGGGSGLQLDLSSTNANILLGTRLFRGSSSVTVNVGGLDQTFSPGSKVTAAQYVAIKQVLGGGSQYLTLNTQGSATGGLFALNTVASPRVTDLVVPQSVTAVGYFSRNPSLGFGGDLINYGSIFGVSTSNRVSSGTIFAQNITNQAGGVITTQLPSEMLSSIANAISSLNLTLSAANNISNAGRIGSSAGLTLSAGGSIVNALPSGIQAAGPVIQAVNNVNLFSGAGTVTNTGVIGSQLGSINIGSPIAATNININAMGGAFQALAGNINVRSPLYSGAANINLNGGDFLSKQLNLFSGAGDIEGGVDRVTGILNTHAGLEHFFASTDTLVLGNNCITGDPTFANTGGNIVINGTNSFTQALSVLASGNITASGSGQLVGNSAGAGTDVILVAGANITLSATGMGGNNAATVNLSAAAPLSNNRTATVNFGAGGGGNIDLSTGAATTVIDTHATSGNNSGGSVTLAAFANGATGGKVLLATGSTVDTRGSGSGNGGAVNVFAGANPGSPGVTIQLGNINTSGGSAAGVNGGAGGAINIVTAQPTGAGGASVMFDQTGVITSNGPITNSATFATNAQVTTGTITTVGGGGGGGTNGNPGGVGHNGGAGGSITIHAGSAITTGGLLAYGGGGGGGGRANGGSQVGGNGGTGGAGGSILLQGNGAAATGSIAVTGDINSSGGGGGGGGAGGGGGGIGGAGGLAATILLNGTSAVSVAGNGLAGDGGVGGNAGTTNSGGGGGSFGGGGGGGGGSAGGGGGGGGAFGGGGGGQGTGATGGAGGGTSGGAAGTGGTANGTAGSAGTGGSGGGGAAGGTLGNGGNAAGAGATNGSNVPGFNGAAAGGGQNNTITITGDGVSVSTGTTGLFGRIVTLQTPSAANGSIALAENIQGTSSVSLAAHLAGGITETSGSISTPTLTITTGGGDVGTSGQHIISHAATLTANAGGAGSVFIDNSSIALTLGTSSAGGAFQLTNTGTLTLNAPGNVTAGSGDLRLSSVGNLTVQSGQLISTSGKVVLAASAGGNLVTNGGNLIIMAGKDIDLTGIAGGAINTTAVSAAAGLVTLTAGTSDATGSLLASGKNVLAGSSGSANSAGGSVTVSVGSTGSIAMGDITSNGVNAGQGGTVMLTSGTGGTLSVGSITANGGATGAGGHIQITGNTNSGSPITIGGAIGTLLARGGATSGDGGLVTVLNSGAGGITLNNFSAINVNATSGNGGTISLNAHNGLTAGPITFNGGGTLSANGSSGFSGGNVLLRGSSLSISGGSLGLQANGTTGGFIFVNTNAPAGAPPAGGDLTMGTGTGQFTVQAGTDAVITIESGGDLTVTSTGGFSSRIANLTGDNNFASNSGGNVSANHVTITAGSGSISLGGTVTSTGSGNTVSITAANNVTSNAGGQISGNNIGITATGGAISIGDNITGTGASNTVSLTAFGNITRTGASQVGANALTLTSTNGSIGLSGSHLSTAVDGTLTAQALVDVFIDNSSTALTLGTSSAGGTFRLSNTGTLTVNASGNVTAGSGDLNLSSSGNLTVQSGQLISTSGKVVLSAGGGGNLVTNGGNLVIAAGKDIDLTGIGGGAINTTAVSAAAGSVMLTAGTSDATGSLLASGKNVVASSSGGGNSAGGSVTVTVDGTGSIAIGDITSNGVNGGQGGTVMLTSGTGGTLAVGSITANGGATGAGGHIQIVGNTNTGSPITIGGAVGTLSARGGLVSGDGGLVTVLNSGAGGITLNNFSAINVSATSGNGGTISLNANNGPTAGPITFNGGGTLSANGSSGFAGGIVELNGSSLSVNGGSLALQANGDTGGFIFVNTTAAAGAPPAGGNLTLGTGTGQFTVQAGTDAVITIQSGGDLTVTSTGGFSSRIANLTAGNDFTSNSGGNVSGNHVTIIATNGSISLGGTVTSTGSGNTVSISAGNNFTSNAGAVISGNSISLTASGSSMSLGDNVSGTGTNASVTLTANGDGAISQTGGAVSSTGSLSINLSGSGGSGSANLTNTQVASLTDNVSAGQFVTVANTGDISVGSITGSNQQFTLTNAGNISVDGVVQGNTIAMTANANGPSLGDITVNNSITSSGTGNSITLVAADNFSSLPGGTIAGNDISITATGGAVSLADAVTGTGSNTSVSLTSSADISNAAVSQISSNNLNLTSTSGNVGISSGHISTGADGTLTAHAFGNVFIDNTSTSLTLGTSSAGGTFYLTESGTLTVNASLNVTAGTGDLSLFSGGDLIVHLGQLNSTSGRVVLAAAGNLVTDGHALTVNAGNNIDLTGIAGGTVDTRGTGAAGPVSLFAGNSVSIGSVLAGGKNILASAAGAGNTAGGGVLVFAGATGSIALGDVTSNGVNGGKGGSVTLHSAGLSVGSITANGGVTGKGGSIDIEGNSASAITIGGVVGTLSAQGGTTSGDGGSVLVEDFGSGGITFNNFSAIDVSATSGKGGIINIAALGGGGLTFNGSGTGTLAANGTSGVQNSSGVFLFGSSLSISGGSLALQANDGTFGTISVQTTAGPGVPPAGGDLTVGTATGQFTVQATGTGAVVSLKSGGDLTVDSTGSFTADNVTLIASRNVSSILGGDIQGNQVSITATNGAISLGGTVAGSGPGNAVSLTSNANITAALVSQVSADTLKLTSTGGSIGILGTPVLTTANHLQLTALTDAFVDQTGNLDLQLASIGGLLQLTDAGNLTISGPASGNTVNLSTSGAGSSITVNSSVSVSAVASMTLTTTQLNLSNLAFVSTSGPSSTIAIHSPTGSDLIIQSPSGGSATIQTDAGILTYNPAGVVPISGTINIEPATGQSLFFTDSGANPTILNLNGGPVVATTKTVSTTASTTVDSNVTVASNSLIVMNISGGTLSNSGMITSSAPADGSQFGSTTSLVSLFGSTVTIESLGGDLTLAGDGLGQISVTGTGSNPFHFNACNCNVPIGPTINVLAYGPDSVNVNSSYTFNSGTLGFTTIGKVNTDTDGNPNMTTGSVNVGSGVTGVTITDVGGALAIQQFYGNINISAPTVNFFGNSSIVSQNNSVTDIKISSNHFDTQTVGLTVNLPDSFNVNFLTGTGGLLIGPTTSTPRAGNNQAFNVPLTFAKTAGSGTTSLNVTGGKFAAFTNSGTSTNGNLNIDAFVTLSSDTRVNFGLTGASLVNNGVVSYTGSATTTSINVQSSVVAFTVGSGDLTLAGSGTFANNATSTTSFLAQGAGHTLTVANGTALQVTGGGPLLIRSPNVTFGAGSSVTATGTSAISVNAGSSAANVNLVITAPAGSAGTLATTGGTISIGPTGNGTLTFANSGASLATVNLNGGPLSITASSSVTVGSSVTVASDKDISISTPQLNLNDGALIHSFASSTINITSPAGFDLTIQAPSGGSATILTAAGVLTYDANNVPMSGTINITPASGQSLFFTDSGGSPTTLNLNGGPVVTKTETVSTTASTTVDPNVTVASDSLIVMNVNNGTLSNSGLITSSASGNSAQFNSTTSLVSKFGSTVTIESLSGSLTMAGNGSGQISATGTGGAPFFFNACNCNINIGPNISVLAYGSNSVIVNSSYRFNTGASAFTTIGKVNTDVSGTVNLGGSIKIGSNVTLTQVGGSLPGLPSNFFGAINFSAPAISFDANSSIVSVNNANSDIKISSNNFDTTQTPLTVTLPDSSSVSLVTGGGFALISPSVRTANGGNNLGNTLLSILKSTGGGITNLNETGGGSLRFLTMNDTVIGNSVHLSGDAAVLVSTTALSLGAGSSFSSGLASGTAISMIGNRPTGVTINLPDSASVSMSTAGGSFFFGPANAPATGLPAGTPPTPLSNLPLLFAKTAGSGTATLNLTGGEVLIQTTGASTTVGDSVTIAADKNVTVMVPQLNLGNLSVISTTGASSTININSPTGSDLTIQAPSGGSATIQSASTTFSFNNIGIAGTGVGLPFAGGINITPASGQALTFSGVGGTLNLTGSSVITSANSSVTVGTSFTLASNSPLVFATTGDFTLTNNGLVTSSAPAASGFQNGVGTANRRTGEIAIYLYNIGGSMTFNGSTGNISATGIDDPVTGRGPQIAINTFSSNSTGINFTSSYTFQPGADGFVNILSRNGFTPGSAGPISVGTGVTLTVSGSDPAGGQDNFVISAPVITFGASTSLVDSKTTGVAIGLYNTFDQPFAGPFTINFTGLSTTNWQTSGGAIRINPNFVALATPGQVLTFQSTSSDTANLVSNAAFVITEQDGTFADNHVAITTSVTSANAFFCCGIAIDIQGGNAAALRGGITLTGTPGLISATAAGTPPSPDGRSPGSPIILIQASGAHSVNINSSYTFNAGPNGDVDVAKLFNTQPGGINLAAGVTLKATGGGTLRLIAPAISMGTGSSVVSDTTSGPAILLLSSSDSAAPLTITGPSGNSASFQTAGGSITIMPTFSDLNSPSDNFGFIVFPAADQQVTFDKSGTGSTMLNMIGGPVTINSNVTTNTSAVTINSGVILSTDHAIVVNMNVVTGPGNAGPILTNNGTITTSASVAPNTPTILIQNTLGDFTLAGIGNYQQTGTTPGDTVFNDAGTITFVDGTLVNTSSTNSGSSTLFFSPVLAVSGSGQVSATVAASSNSQIVLNPRFVPGTGPVEFSLGTGATSATLNFNGAPVSTKDGAVTDVLVDSGVTVASDNTITFNVGGGLFQNNGTVTSSAAGPGATITVQSTSGELTVDGLGTISQINSTPGLTVFSAATDMTFVNGVSQTINNGFGTAATPLTIVAPNVKVTAATPVAAIATLSTSNAGAITIKPSLSGTGSLTFSVTDSATSATLNLNGGPVTTTSDGDTTIGSDFTLQSDHDVVIQATGSGNIVSTDSTSHINTTGALTLMTNGGNIGTSLNPINTDASVLSVNAASGNAFVNDSGSVDLGASAAHNFTLTSGGTISASTGSTFSGTLTMNSAELDLNTNATLKAVMINLTGTNGLTIGGDGSGTLWGTSTASGTPGPTAINLTTVNSSTNVTFASDVTLKTGDGSTPNNGTVNINAGNPDGTQSIVVSSGVTVTSNGVVELNTCDLTLQGTLNAPTVNFNCPFAGGTIANSQGDVNLVSSFNLHGQSFAIIASGNINEASGGTTIDLSSTSADGGSLTMVAGFDFSPATGGQVGPNQEIYSFTGTSSSGGSINMGSSTITTGSSNAGSNGGNVLVVAHGGVTNQGSITLGTITTSATGAGGTSGAVTVIGQGGVTMGFINTSGLSGAAGGPVNISSATPQTSGTPRILGGELVDGTFIPTPGNFDHDIALAGINAGAAGTVTLTTGGTGAVNSSSPILTGTLNVRSGSGGIGTSSAHLSTNASTLTADAGTTGDVFITDGAVTVNIVGTNRAANYTLSASAGSIDIGASAVMNIFSINLLASNTINLESNSLMAVTDGSGNGGSINLTAADITGSIGANPVLLNASGTGTGNGGSISVLTTGLKHIGVGAGDITLTATSGPSGGNGGSASFLTTGALDIRTNGSGDPSGISVGPQGTDGNGGGISLTGATITWSSSAISALNLSANGNGTGSGGSVSVTLTAPSTNATIGTGMGNFNLVATGANGGSASFTTTGVLTLVTEGSGKPQGINVSPGLTGNGGIIDLSATSVAWSTSGTTALSLDVSGRGTGLGGEVAVEQTSTATATIGTEAGQFNLMANGGSSLGVDNAVIFSTGGSLVVNTAGIGVTAGTNRDGSTIELLAGTGGPGTLVVNSPLSANGNGSGKGGAIVLQSNSGTVFNIGKTGNSNTNGVRGGLSVTGTGGNGTISVTNLAGGITSQVALTAVGDVSLTAGGANGAISVRQSIGDANTDAITLTAAGTGKLTVSGSRVLTADTVELAAGTANIGSGSGIRVNAETLSANTAGTGLVALHSVGTGPLTLEDSSAGKSFTLKAASGSSVTLNNITTANGKIKVNVTNASLETAPSAVISATNGSLTLQTNNSATSSILIGANGTLSTLGTGGQVTIAVGGTGRRAGTLPANVVVNHVTPVGSAFFGNNGITASAPNNTLNLKGANIVFNTNSQPATAIQLGGGVTITADPVGVPSSTAPIGVRAGASVMPTQTVAQPGATAQPQPAARQISPGVFEFNPPAAAPQKTADLVSVASPSGFIPSAAAMHGAYVGEQSESVMGGQAEPAVGEIEAAISCEKDLGIASSRARLADFETSTFSAGKRVALRNGNVLFASTVDTVVDSSFGTVSIDARSVVLVMASRDSLAVYNLDDCHRNAVVVSVGARKLSLTPGRHVVITSDEVADFSLINPAESFGYRNMTSTKLGAGLKCFASEFSMTQAIRTVKPLRQMTSSRNAQAARLASHFMKTAAVVMQMGAAAGQYQHIPHPRVMAYSP